MSEYATNNQTPEEYREEQEALLQREEFLRIFSDEQLRDLKADALNRLNEAEQIIHAVNNVLDERYEEL